MRCCREPSSTSHTADDDVDAPRSHRCFAVCCRLNASASSPTAADPATRMTADSTPTSAELVTSGCSDGCEAVSASCACSCACCCCCWLETLAVDDSASSVFTIADESAVLVASSTAMSSAAAVTVACAVCSCSFSARASGGADASEPASACVAWSPASCACVDSAVHATASATTSNHRRACIMFAATALELLQACFGAHAYTLSRSPSVVVATLRIRHCQVCRHVSS